MALVGSPALLILDEPTAGLDPNGAPELRKIIKAETERGATVFFSSHILEQVEAVADRVGIMNEGGLVAADSIERLRAVTLVVVLFTAGITGLVGATSDEAAAEVFRLSFQLVGVALPIVALFVAKGAITGERESGSLRVLLSLPPSRRDILLGKLFIGRTALILVATLLGGAATGLVVVTSLGGGLGLLVPFFAFLGLMEVAFVAVGIGISAASASDGRATASAVGVSIVIFVQLVGIFPPNRAVTAAYESVTAGDGLFAADPLGSAWLPTLVLVAWLVVPVAAGYLRFRDAQIG